MVEFAQLLKNRRSIRDYEERDVPLETIKEMIKESCLAPSSANGQPWRFIIVKSRVLMKRLSDDSKKNLLEMIESNPASPLKRYESAFRSESFNVFYNAPSLVYVIGPKKIASIPLDCTLAASYFMFSATERGLGTCWIGLGKYIQDPELLRLIGLPDDCEIVAPTPTYAPVPTSKAPARLALGPKVQYLPISAESETPGKRWKTGVAVDL